MKTKSLTLWSRSRTGPNVHFFGGSLFELIISADDYSFTSHVVVKSMKALMTAYTIRILKLNSLGAPVYLFDLKVESGAV